MHQHGYFILLKGVNQSGFMTFLLALKYKDASKFHY